MEELVTLTEIKPEYRRILLPMHQHIPARVGESYQQLYNSELHDLGQLVYSARKSRYLAIDLETRGTDYSLPLAHSESGDDRSVEIVGIALAWDTGSCYFDWINLTDHEQRLVNILLQQHSRLVAHNVYFDGGFLRQHIGAHLSWAYCTYATIAHLANEGHVGYSGWSLKDAMREFLGWKHTNEAELDLWLVTNGYYTGSRRVDTSVEYLTGEYMKWLESEGTGKRKGLGPDKGEMWRAPTAILGKYSVLDAEATYLLLTQILLPTLAKFPKLDTYLTSEYIPHILVHIDQHIRGMKINVPLLRATLSSAESHRDQLYHDFTNHPKVRPHLLAIEANLRSSMITMEPPRYTKCNVEDPGPTKLTRKGQIDKNWQTKYDKWVAHDHERDDISARWLAWIERRDKIIAGELEGTNFNINSDLQMVELMYGKLGYPIELRTESGEPSTSTTAWAKCGDIGKILVEYAAVCKQITYLTKYVELTEYRDTIHPYFRMPGTETGRLSGTEPNIQQLSKSREMMEPFTCFPDNLLVDLDFTAIEAILVAEFSGDTNMRALYGDLDNPNDPHLFLGAAIPGEIGERIKASGYDPFRPTQATISQAKSECKRERQICKTCIAAGTPVRVKNKGWLPIEQVLNGDYVWDGFTWVQTDGHIDKGIATVYNIAQVRVTEDHRILDNDYKWRTIQEGITSEQCLKPNRPSANWSDVWQLVCTIFRMCKKKWASIRNS